MHKIYHSLQLLNYNLKKCFNPPVIKIIENEKYVANNEHNERKIPSNENFVATVNYKNSDTLEDPICKTVFTRSCETLFCNSKITSESKNIPRKWNKNGEDELVNEDYELTFDYPLGHATENETSLQNKHKSSKYRLVQYDSHPSFDYSSKNTKRSEKSFKDLSKNVEHGMVRNSCNTSFDYPSKNTRGSKKSFGYLHMIRNDELIQNDSNTSLDYPSRDVVKGKKLLRNRVKNNEDLLIYENSETSLGYPSQNVQKCRKSFRKLHKNKEDELVCKDFEWSTKLSENDLTMKSSSISAIWSSVKQLQNKTQPKRASMSLSEKIKIVENPKYLPGYTPYEKELEEDNPFDEPSQSFMYSPEKVQKDPKCSQDSISQCFRNVKCSNTDDRPEETHPGLEDVAWVNNEFYMRDLVSESNAVKNISVERNEIEDQKKMPMSLRDLNPFESNEEHFSFEKDQY